MAAPPPPPPGFFPVASAPQGGHVPPPPPGFIKVPDFENMTQDDRSSLVPGTLQERLYNDWIRKRNDGLPDREQEWQKTRTYPERLGSAASFVASAPVRALSQGQFGAADIIGLLSPSVGASVQQGEDDFRRANPGLMHTLGGIGEVAGGIPALNTMGGIARPPPGMSTRVLNAEARAAEAVRDVGSFERSGVRQFGPSLNEGPVAGTARGLADTIVIGGPVKSALETSLGDTAQAAQRVASNYGGTATAEQAGGVVRQGLERFRDARPVEIVEREAAGYTPAQRSEIIAQPARDTSLKTKQAALYERAWDNIPEPMRQGRSIEGSPRVMGDMPQTRALLQEVEGRNMRMINASRDGAEGAARPIAQGGLVGRMVDAMMTPNWRASLQTMRDIRSDFRRLASGLGDTEKNTLRLSDIERLQGTITQDMVGVLERNANSYRESGQHQTAAAIDRSIREFRRADQFTALSAQRLESIEKLFNANDATTLYRNVTQAMLGRERGNIEAFRVLRRTLRPGEMSELASGVISQLGAPVGSARGASERLGFSVESFMTRWNNMNPEAKHLLFAGPHGRALEDLVNVARRLSNVEAWTNKSRSGTTGVNVGTLLAGGGAYAHGGLETFLGSLAAGGTASIIMGSETYAKWMVQYLRARAAAYRQGATAADKARVIAATQQLGYLAKRDPSLRPAYDAVRDDNGVK